jgi:hypothetical protein
MHSVSDVLFERKVLTGDGLPKAGPPGTGIVLGAGVKQRVPATDTQILTFSFKVVILTGKGPLGAFAARDLILLGGELPLPFIFSFFNGVGHDGNLFALNSCVDLITIEGDFWIFCIVQQNHFLFFLSNWAKESMVASVGGLCE